MSIEKDSLHFARLLLHFQFNVPGKGKRCLCFVQWYHCVCPGMVDATGLVEYRLLGPDEKGLQVLDPDSIARMVHMLPNLLVDDVVYANHCIDVDFYQGE